MLRNSCVKFMEVLIQFKRCSLQFNVANYEEGQNTSITECEFLDFFGICYFKN